MGVLSSPRRRRRVAWLGAAAATAGAIALVALLVPVHHARLASSRTVPTPAQTPVRPKARLAARRPFTAADRKAIGAVLAKFVDHGIARHDPLAAYSLATPAMRAAATRAQWARGELPVMPYTPTRPPAWSIASHSPGDAIVDLTLRKGGQHEQLFSVELKQVGRRWLVDSVVPTVTLGPNGQVASFRDLRPGGTADSKARLGAVWLLLPVVVLALLLVVPLAIVIAGRRRKPPIRQVTE